MDFLWSWLPSMHYQESEDVESEPLPPIHMKIEVSEHCFESFPCKHWVTLDGIHRGLFDGQTIEELLRVTNNTDDKMYSHFAEYRNLGNINNRELISNR